MSRKEDGSHLETTGLTGGYGVEEMVSHGSLAVPLFQTLAYPYASAAEAEAIFDPNSGVEGFIYGRRNNPTVDIFEKRMAQLEGGEAALATSSGMSAIALLALRLARQGEIVLSNRVYACTFELCTRYLSELGIVTRVITDPTDYKAWEEAITQKTRFLLVETPSNPGLFIADLERLGAIAREAQVPLVVDNTLASPALQRPLLQGADMVVESASKYISGNGTVLGGVIIADAPLLSSLRREEYIQFGPTPSPFNAWQMLLGLETLALRMERHSQNALAVASFLEDHEKVKAVNYPGLKSHPQHLLAARQMSAFGSLLSFSTVGDKEEAFAFMDSLKLIPNVTHEGSARTILCHPASTNFGRLTQTERKEAGISNSLIRMSVGIEKLEDILEDLHQALVQI